MSPAEYPVGPADGAGADACGAGAACGSADPPNRCASASNWSGIYLPPEAALNLLAWSCVGKV